MIEVDGAYVGGKAKQANEKADRKDRRIETPAGRQSVIVACKWNGRTLTTVVAKGSQGVAFVRSVVTPGTIVHADEAKGWDVLRAHYETRRINHSVAFS